MASYFYAPAPLNDTFLIPGTNTPGNGVQLFLYAAVSSTKQTAYKDNAGNASWSNPIVLDSGGNLPSAGAMWFLSGQTYKAVYAPSNDTDPPASPYRTIDNLAGINDVSATQSEWTTGPTPTFVSGTQFTMSGDQTVNFKISRRLKFTVTAGTVYGTISSVSFSVNTTTVNVAFSSGALDAGLSAVSYSVISVDNPSIDADYTDKQASSVASAVNGTTNIWGVAGNSVHITGTNPISSFSTTPYTGAIRELIFDGAIPLNFNASTLVLPGSANMTTAAGDTARVLADSGSTRVLSISRNSALPTNSWQFLGSTTAASTVNFSLSWTGIFNHIKIFANNIVPTISGANLLTRFSGDGTNFDNSAAYNSAFMEFNGASSGNVQSATSSPAIVGSVDNSAGQGIGMTIEFMDATSLFSYKTAVGSGFTKVGTSSEVFTSGVTWNNSSNVQGINMFWNTGSTATGMLRAFGIKDS